ncbi:hypothetical protein CLV63_12029 [Murinocardiopsis flavida]|uniref:Lipoprotein n=1 Tax=Murinocardiopsis flavida TaxID=645275 RepID=A0A2P8D247_9ACTN|nr:hypothetical protein [Murinocardiopsis flavida]PSK91303.1 hypothetical protein CLV63_12029 [Murinocardiopsis flavida]
MPAAAVLSAVLAVSACTGSGGDGGGNGGEGDGKGPQPVPADKMDKASLPDTPADLAPFVQERMQEALTVEVGIELSPEADQADPIKETVLDLRMSDPPAATMQVVDTEAKPPTTTDIVVLDDVIYTKMPKGEALVEGKPWMRMSQPEVDKAKEELGPFAEIFTVILDETISGIDEATGDSSLRLVQYGTLEGKPETAEEGGETLTTYKGSTKAQKLSDLGDETYSDLADQGLESVDWSLTVSDKGLPTELSASVLSPKGEKATSTVHYKDWGKKLDIAAPPKGEVGTLEESLAE